MNESAEKVLSYLTGSGNIAAVSVEDLQKLVAEHPYFAITQFLLAKKLKSEQKPQYSAQVQKTSLYFSNPYWLQYQFSEDNFIDDPFEEELARRLLQEKQEDSATNTVPKVIEDGHLSNSPVSADAVLDNANTTQTSDFDVDASVTEANRAESSIDEGEPSAGQKEIEQAEFQNVVQVDEEISAITRSTNEEADDFISHLDADSINSDPNASANVLEDTPPASEAEVVELEEEMAGVTHTQDQTTREFLEETEQNSADGSEAVQDEHDRMFQNIKAMLDATSEEADADTQDDVIPIDPYYTIDYFASQGIKLELEKNPQDQLGQNLKKFTQWLKHMKKLGPEDATEAINRAESEADIQQIADSSNTVREVVTEAMASVLEKQGKKEKAIELYNKLSFLYPNKNAYFADKIKKLKGI